MNKYNIFLTFFIISVIAFIFFLVVYIQAIFGLIYTLHSHHAEEPDPFMILNILFTPAVIVSAIVLGLTSLVYRILGIVQVAKNKIINEGEKAFWILGFIFFGFITGIVFLIMAKSKKFVESV